jgi:dipeptidase E
MLSTVMARRLLLISTSTVFGTRYLEHAFDELRDVLRGVKRVLFIPFALKDHAGYAAKARAAFEEIGFGLDSLHESRDAERAIAGAEAVFCGGGNTFRLLDALYALDALLPIRRRVEQGMPYTGASAGSNLACPTIMTTNDMPIVEPLSFEALGLVPFQINPHYLDPMPRVEGDSVELRGRAGARIFRPGQEPVEVAPIAEVGPLVL